MAKDTYRGSIEIIDGFKPMNGASIDLMSADHIWILSKWDKRLGLDEPEDWMSTNLSNRIQELEDDKVSRHGDNTLKGHYEIVEGGLRVGTWYDADYTQTEGQIWCEKGIVEETFKCGLMSDKTNYCFEVDPTKGSQQIKINAPTVFDDYVTVNWDTTFDADVTITGNLTVQGTTYTTDAEILKVKDNLIILNIDDDDSGSTLKSGMVMCGENAVGSDVYYGLIFNPSDETVRLGQGSLNDSGSPNYYKFTFNTNEDGESQGIPFALRDEDENIGADKILQWNKTRKCIVSSGYTLNEYWEKSLKPLIQNGGSTLDANFPTNLKALRDNITTYTDGKDESLQNQINQLNTTLPGVYLSQNEYEFEKQVRIEKRALYPANKEGKADISVNDNNVEIHIEGPVKNLEITSINMLSTGGDCIERFSVIFRAGDLISTGLYLTLPYNYTIVWAVYPPVFESNKIYHLVFTRFARENVLLGNWVVYDK